MLRIFYTASLILTSFLCLGQNEFSHLDSKLKKADSVFIISYNPCMNMCGFSYQADLNDTSHSEMKFHNVIERIRIQDTAFQSLKKILISPIKQSGFIAKCLVPNHGILIYSRKEKLYLDLSFNCRQYTGSFELRPYDEMFDENKWQALFNFFYQKGIRFRMGDETESLKAYENYLKKKE